jgi:lipopolysaccharide transport protein LptA
MANTRLNLIRILKLLIAAVFLAIVVVIAVNFISFSRKQPEIMHIEDKIPPEKEEMESGQFIEIKEGETVLDVNFDKQFVDDKGLAHYVGNVHAIYREKYELSADEIVHDKDWTHYKMIGSGKVRYEDAVLEGSYLEYDAEGDVIKTDRSATFSSERITGFAQKLTYFLEQEKLELKEQFYLQLSTKLDPSSPLIVEGKNLEYSKKNKQGHMEGSVQFFKGQSRGTADSAEFTLFPNEENIRSVRFKGNVQATLAEETEGQTMQQIQADELFLRAFLDSTKIHILEAQGRCRFGFVRTSGDSQQGESEFLKCIVNRDGRLREFHALGRARLVEEDGQTEERRIVEGESLVIVEAREGLQIKGSEEYKASLSSRNYEISAKEIILDTEGNNLTANGQVKVILNPAGKDQAMGFFSQDKSVFITSEELRYIAEEKRFLFKGGSKSWQEKEILLTDELSINQETGMVLCTGKVKSIFPYTSKNTEEEGRVEISAKKMDFDPEEMVITFQDGCSLLARDVSMTCKSIRIHLGEGQKEMQNMIAEGDVIIQQEQSEGRAKEARFDINNETIVLLGNPVLVDKNRGKIEGDKLTFYIADDRIVVENQGQERSITVIKS